MHRSLNPGMIGVQTSFEETLALAKEFDFDGVSIDIQGAAKTAASKVTDLLESYGKIPSVFGLPTEFRGDESQFEKYLSDLPGLAQTAAEIGLTRCSTWVLPGRKGTSEVDYLAELKHRLGECGRVLHDFGIRFGLEYIGPKTFREGAGIEYLGPSNAARMLDLIDSMGVPGVGLLLDSWHWYTAHDTAQTFDILSNELVVDVHLNDAPKGIPIDEQVDNVRELPGATGVIDLKAFIAGLEKIGYDGPAAAEPFNQALRDMDDREAVAKTAEAMKKFV